MKTVKNHLTFIAISIQQILFQGVFADDLLMNERRKLLLITDNLLASSEEYIVINTQDNNLSLRTVEKDLYLASCATGSGRKLQGEKKWYKWQFYTPSGKFKIEKKTKDPLWIRPTWDFIENNEEIPVFAEDKRRFERGFLGEYALYFAPGYMIHGTIFEINLGKSITHGCVRVGSKDLAFLYKEVDVGCVVYIY